MIVFRTDSSLQMGSGHVMRCLTLADELRQRGTEVLFICREHPSNIIRLIEEKGYPVSRLPLADAEFISASGDVTHAAWLGVSWQQDAVETIAAVGEVLTDWLIVDHYSLDRRWEELLRPNVGKIMVIDDIADRPHDCDLLLDQNLYDNMESRYIGLVPKQCVKLLGPGYALLRPEFMKARKNLRERDGSVKRILIFFGGSDPGNETAKALDAIRLINRPDIAVDVVVGATNQTREEIRTLCAAIPNTIFHCQVSNMAELMAAADLAIGAGGSTTWERCFLGLPALIVAIADNQFETSCCLAGNGSAWFAGTADGVSPNKLEEYLRRLLVDPFHLVKASIIGKLIVDGSGSEAICRNMQQIQFWENMQ